MSLAASRTGRLAGPDPRLFSGEHALGRHDIAQWRGEIAWMSLNFSVAVWPGLALFTFGLVKDRLLPSPRIGRHFCGGLKYRKSGGA